MGGPVNRCVLVSFAVLAVLQNIVDAQGFGLRDLTNDCQSELAFCLFPALLPYSGLTNPEQTLAKARATPFATHCKDWSGAVECSQHFRSKACQNASRVTDEVLKFVKVLDLFVNYACKENPTGMNNAYQCLLQQSVINGVTNEVLNATRGPGDVCDRLPEYVAVASKSVADRCGSDAGKVGNGLFTRTSEAFVDFIINRKCSPKHKRIPSMMERFFSRK